MHHQKILFFFFLLSIPSITLSQITHPCPLFPEVRDNYKPNKNWHVYQVENVLCDLKKYPSATAKKVFQVMLESAEFIAPGAPNQPVKNCNSVLLMHEWHIVTKINALDLSVTNYTMPDHILFEGKIVRQIVQKGDKIMVFTMGRGNNRNGVIADIQNRSLPMETLWTYIDEKLKVQVEKRLEHHIQDKLDIINRDTPTAQAKIIDSTSKYLSYGNGSNSINKAKKTSINNSLVGGLTEDALGKILLRAIVTNNKQLWINCIHPNCDSDIRDAVENSFDEVRESLEEAGLTQWNLVKFSRVMYFKESPLGSSDKGEIDGEQIRRDFRVEFTYKNDEFIGEFGHTVIFTYKNKFFMKGTSRGSMHRF